MGVEGSRLFEGITEFLHRMRDVLAFDEEVTRMPKNQYERYYADLEQALHRLRASGVLSPSAHGNLSVRIPDREEMVLTADSMLQNLGRDRLAVVTFAGAWRAGAQVGPSSRQVLGMHGAVYQAFPLIGAVVHSHSPHLTAYAVARRAMPCYTEALARHGQRGAIPLVPWAPRGSGESVHRILETVRSAGQPVGVLLASHGALAFGASAQEAVEILIDMEENAMMGLLAERAGGPVVLTSEDATAAFANRERMADSGPV